MTASPGRLLVVATAATGLLAACGTTPAADSAATSATSPADPGTRSESMSPAATGTAPAPEDLGPAPSLVGLDGWLQSDVTGLDDLRGRVTIVQFWTFGCINCKHTLPHLQEIYATHHADGLEIVGVHSPEFDYEKDPARVAAAAEDLGVTWPIALDTHKASFRAWQGDRRFWPRTYVVDQNGRIRFDRIGEGAYDRLENTVAWLLSHPV